MTSSIQLDTSLNSFYDAIATCDEYTSNNEANLVFDSMYKDMLVNSSGKFLTVLDKTKTEDMNILLDSYQQRIQVNADAWTHVEAEFLSNISNYCFDKHMEFKNDELHQKGYSIKFTPIKIKAVIDWLDLSFEVNPSICKFAHKSNARSYIKSFLTSKTGTKHYVKYDESHIDQQGLAFTIRLHDIRNKEDLLKITHLLATQYGADYLQMKISNIELSLDFYNVPSRAFLSALHKSVKYSKTAENFRIYKYMKDDTRNKLTLLPNSPLLLLNRFNNDWCLGVNPKGSPLCYRLYPKTTDSNKLSLQINEHRLRAEVTLNSDMLKNIDCHLSNLTNIIKLGFKYLTFTKLDEKASEEMKADYSQHIDPFGMEKDTTSENRNKRSLANGVKTYSELNSLVSKAIANQCRQF
ncbi:hypothetical protein [Acinetobacter celticus]|uniref:Uncharacterized protein n=1 Tax=Acinetobacter celticus TaxID=1891224 RepID=A0A1C3D0P6_9GAMM|nr:hypothetical protein [Acinetobacter celticus]ODA14540.1 hypothetical protein BBP83_01695 [Acinetobacter celticus]